MAMKRQWSYKIDAVPEQRSRMDDDDVDEVDGNINPSMKPALRQDLNRHLKKLTQRNNLWKLHEQTESNDQKQLAKMTAKVFCDGSVNGNNCTESEQIHLFTLKSLYCEKSGFQYKIKPGSVTSKAGIEKDDSILSVNGISITSRDPGFVGQFVKLLVQKRKNFHLVLCRIDECSEYEFYDVTFLWRETGYDCLVTGNNNGRTFPKNLDVLGIPQAKKCFLITAKHDWCVAMDGEHVYMQKMQDETHRSSTITAYMYNGNETDPESEYYNKKHVCVLGFKLKCLTNDTTRSLAATDQNNIALLDADIPDHAVVLQTKADSRFFYTRSVGIETLHAFESTQFETHFLAVKETGNPADAPILYLKKLGKVSDAELRVNHHDVLFQIVLDK